MCTISRTVSIDQSLSYHSGFIIYVKNVVIPRGTSYKQALGENCTTVITTTVHIPGHLIQRCSERLIRSCVSSEANV